MVDALPPNEDAPHVPVMVAEVTGFLRDRGTVVDMTLGAGGHARALLESGVERVIGIDRDRSAITMATERLAPYGSRFRAVETTFSGVDHELTDGAVDGILFDLGVSSMQLDTAERGFGYRKDGPLDMRMGGDGPSAADLVNEGRFGRMAALHGDDIVDVSLDEATKETKTVPPEWYDVAKAFFG